VRSPAVRELENDGGIALGFENGDTLFVGILAPKDGDIGHDFALDKLQVEAFLDAGDIARAQLRLQLVAYVNDRARVEVTPQGAVLQIGVHAGKRACHALT
jgi:hypothetical protein